MRLFQEMGDFKGGKLPRLKRRANIHLGEQFSATRTILEEEVNGYKNNSL